MAQKAAALLKHMAHPGRLLVLCALGERDEMTAGELCELTGLSPSALTQHLTPLRKAGLLGVRREHKFRHYRLASEDATTVIAALRGIFCPER